MIKICPGCIFWMCIGGGSYRVVKTFNSWPGALCLVSFRPSFSHAFWRWKVSKDGGVERGNAGFTFFDKTRVKPFCGPYELGHWFIFSPLSCFSVDLLDTSTAQGELGWLPDPPEVGVSTHIQGRGASTKWWKNIIHVEISPYPWKLSSCGSTPSWTF